MGGQERRTTQVFLLLFSALLRDTPDSGNQFRGRKLRKAKPKSKLRHLHPKKTHLTKSSCPPHTCTLISWKVRSANEKPSAQDTDNTPVDWCRFIKGYHRVLAGTSVETIENANLCNNLWSCFSALEAAMAQLTFQDCLVTTYRQINVSGVIGLSSGFLTGSWILEYICAASHRNYPAIASTQSQTALICSLVNKTTPKNSTSCVQRSYTLAHIDISAKFFRKRNRINVGICFSLSAKQFLELEFRIMTEWNSVFHTARV